MRKDILNRREEIELWISQSRPKAYICRELKCRPLTLEGYLKRLGLSYKGNMSGKGYRTSPTRKSADEYLFKGSTIHSHKLKLKLLRNNFKQKICESCESKTWLNVKVRM